MPELGACHIDAVRLRSKAPGNVGLRNRLEKVITGAVAYGLILTLFHTRGPLYWGSAFVPSRLY